MITKEEVNKLRFCTETARVERTISKGDMDKFQEAICAFSNDMANSRQPGYLLIGVHDDGRLSAFEMTVYRNTSSVMDKSKGTSQGSSQGTSQGTSQASNQRTHKVITQNISNSNTRSVPSRGVPSPGTSQRTSRGTSRGTSQNNYQIGLEIVGNSILKFCLEPKTLRGIADYLGVKSYKKVKARYMDKLISEGKLAMTVSDKPTSRLQKYVAIHKKRR